MLMLVAILVSIIAGWIALAPNPARASSRLAGNVVAVDETKHQLTLTDAGRQHVVTLAADVVVRQGVADRRLSDLHRGDRVVVTLDESSPSLARIVSIAGPPAARRKAR